MAAINVPDAPRGLPLPFGIGPINWWIVAGLVVFGFGAVMPVLQNSTATTQGFDMQRLQDQQVQLQSDIKLLEADVANLTSLNRIEQRAAVIGLSPGDNPIYVHVDVAGPAPAKLPSQYIPAAVPVTAKTQSWWRSLIP